MQNRSWATDLIVEQAASDCIPPPHVALAAGLRLVRRANNMHIGSIPFLRERHNFFAVIVGSPAFVPAGVFCSARRTVPASGRDGQFFRRQRTVAALSYYPISCLPLSLADRCRAWFSGQRTLSMIFDRLHGALPWERVIDSVRCPEARSAKRSTERSGQASRVAVPALPALPSRGPQARRRPILKAPRKLASCASAIREQKTASRSTDPRRHQCRCRVAAEQPQYLNLTSFGVLSRTVDAQSGTMRLQPQRPTRLRKQRLDRSQGSVDRSILRHRGFQARYVAEALHSN